MDSTDDHHDSYVFYPLSSIFSATHSDAQARLNQSTTEPFQASDHLHEFEMAVYRLGQLRRGHRAYESEKLEEKDLGFSSRVEEELDGLHKSWEAEGPGTRRPGLPSSAEDRVEGYEITEDVVWKANYKKVETRRTAARTELNTDSHQTDPENEILHRNIPLRYQRLSKWTTFWFLFTTPFLIWDLWAMRAGTGKMISEELFFTWIPLPISPYHWLTNPIAQAFPCAMECVLNIAYLLLTCVFRWPPALLLAFASVTLTFGQTISVCIQAYFYPNFMASPLRLSAISWTVVIIFRLILPALISFHTARELCRRLVAGDSRVREDLHN